MTALALNRTRLGIVFFIALNGCVSHSTHQTITHELERTKEETKHLNQSNKDILSELTNRERKLASLQEEIKVLHNKGKFQSADLELLSQRNIELTHKASYFNQQNQDLMETLESQTLELEDHVQELKLLKEREVKRTQTEQKERNQLNSIYVKISSALEGEINQDKINIKRTADHLEIQLAENILYASGKARIKPEGQQTLDRIGIVIGKIPDIYIEIRGHTDNVPISSRMSEQFSSNWELSTARASRVVRYFVDQVGLLPSRLSATGYADTRPIADNATAEGRRTNRRIEIVLSPQPGAE